MFKTPHDFYKMVTNSFAALPKTPDDVKNVMTKVQNVYATEAKNASECIKTYQKAATGDASANEIAAANKKAQALGVTARFAAVMSIPGAIFMIPALKDLELNLVSDDFIPDSVRKEFNI